MAIEIVDLPIDSMVIFHSYVNVYQRVSEYLISLRQMVHHFLQSDHTLFITLQRFLFEKKHTYVALIQTYHEHM